MKTIKILTVLLFISLTTFAQKEKQKDSVAIEQAKINKIVAEIEKTPVGEFNKWCYETIPAKQYNDFVQLYNAYIRNKYAEQQKTTK